MAAYGAFISAPLSHFFVGFFQKLFAGRTGAIAKIGQLIGMLSIQTPITAVVYIASMAVINGARSAETVSKTVQMGLPSVLRVSYVKRPIFKLGS
jgi:peroxisomal membrane protein 2